jgi:manganese/zinc/iron transport system substrate-binding protein
MARLAAVVLLLVCFVTGCNGGRDAADGETTSAPGEHSAQEKHRFDGSYPIQVVCTTGMVADIALHVGGGHVSVSGLMGEGVDPHLYRASPGDVSQLSRANIIFYSGLHLEGKLAELLERMGRRKPTVGVAEKVPSEKVLVDEHGARDPHVWFDVALWSEAVKALASALADFDSKHAEDYHLNATKYVERLMELDAYARERLASVPKDQRVLVTAHDAFRYFGRAYDVEVRGIQGISTDSEAGVRQVKELVDYLVERKIKAVFVETSVSDQNIRSLLEGCQARGHQVVIGGSLFSDAMGKDGTPEGTYEGMVRHNVDTIVAALK